MTDKTQPKPESFEAWIKSRMPNASTSLQVDLLEAWNAALATNALILENHEVLLHKFDAEAVYIEPDNDDGYSSGTRMLSIKDAYDVVRPYLSSPKPVSDGVLTRIFEIATRIVTVRSAGLIKDMVEDASMRNDARMILDIIRKELASPKQE